MSKTISVYPLKSKVQIAGDSIPAVINGIAIYAYGGVLYEIVWWKDGTRHSSWLGEHEFSVESSLSRNSFGFK